MEFGAHVSSAGGIDSAIDRIAAFPAPLCEACNLAMKLNGEYRASDDSTAARREYQCLQCGAAKMIRRTRCAA